MNLEILNLIVSIIGQIGTWITILLVFLTLKEMEKQRRESYKPVIVIPRFGLQAEGKEKGETVLFDDLYRGGVFDDEQKAYRGAESERPKFGKWAHVVLYNLGAGAAKDITIKWKLDFELPMMVNSIKDFFYKNSIPIIVEINDESLKVHQKFSPDDDFIVSCAIEPGKDNIDYLLPQTVEASGIRLTLPTIYQKIISLLATGYQNKSTEWPAQDLPLILDVRYQDIGNTEYKNRYRLRIAHHFWVTNSDTNKTHFECLLEATQIH